MSLHDLRATDARRPRPCATLNALRTRVGQYLTFVLLSLTVGAASAGDDVVTYSIVPVEPTADTRIQFRMDVVGCFEADVESSIDPETGSVSVFVHAPDFCDPDAPGATDTPRFHDIGLLPAGAHTIRVFSCGGPVPPPLPPCQLVLERVVMVGASQPDPVRVPAGSGVSWLVLALGTALLAGSGIGRSR